MHLLAWKWAGDFSAFEVLGFIDILSHTSVLYWKIHRNTLESVFCGLSLVGFLITPLSWSTRVDTEQQKNYFFWKHGGFKYREGSSLPTFEGEMFGNSEVEIVS